MIFQTPELRLEADDRIATLWLEPCPRGGWGPARLAALAAALAEVEARPLLDVLVIRPAALGAECWPAGVHPRHLLDAEDAEGRLQLTADLQRLCARLAALPQATLAVLDGAVHDFGLELALACDRRLAVASPGTSLGFPGAKLGLPPCGGASLRLPRLVGCRRALELLSQGQPLSARAAARLGLVDDACSPRRAAIDARLAQDALQDLGRKPTRSIPLADRVGWIRRSRLRSFGNAEVPTPALPIGPGTAESRAFRADLLTAVSRGFASPARCLEWERGTFAQALASDRLRAALRLEAHALRPLRRFPADTPASPALPDRVGVVGAGPHGCELAAWLALRGLNVVLQDRSPDALAQADARIAAHLAAAVRDGRTTPLEASAADSRVRRTRTWDGFALAGWVIEAVDEDTGVKLTAFQEIEDRVLPRVPVVSTSTALRLEPMQGELRRPGRFAGVHLLFGPGRTPVAELVRAPLTDGPTLEALEGWLLALGKGVVLTGDRPGRVLARVSQALLAEAVQLASEGMSFEDVDAAALAVGLPEGPLASIDRRGLRAVADLSEQLRLSLGEAAGPQPGLSPLLEAGVAGFYRGGKSDPLARMALWAAGDSECVRPYTDDPADAARDAQRRLVSRVVAEAAACLADDDDAGPEAIDRLIARCLGFAQPEGGPLSWADRAGLDAVAGQGAELARRYGRRFAPGAECQRRADAGETFHGVYTAARPRAQRPVRQAG